MNTHTDKSMSRISDYPRRALRQTEEWASHFPTPRRSSVLPLMGMAVVAVGILAWMNYGADLARYMKMRNM